MTKTNVLQKLLQGIFMLLKKAIFMHVLTLENDKGDRDH